MTKVTGFRTPKFMKKIIKVIWSIIKGTFYYSTAIIFAIILMISLWGLFGYYCYDTYYLGYLGIQDKWTTVDGSYVNDLNVISKEYDNLKQEVKEFEWANKEDKNEAENNLKIANSIIKDSELAMTFDDKLISYKDLSFAAEQLMIVANMVDSNNIKNNLSGITEDNTIFVQEYNEAANQWNAEAEKFPLRLVARIANFQEWKLFN